MVIRVSCKIDKGEECDKYMESRYWCVYYKAGCINPSVVLESVSMEYHDLVKKHIESFRHKKEEYGLDMFED